MKTLAAKFHDTMLETYRLAKSDCGYKATYFLQMVTDIGGVEAAHRLLASTGPATGLTELWLCGRLDLRGAGATAGVCTLVFGGRAFSGTDTVGQT